MMIKLFNQFLKRQNVFCSIVILWLCFTPIQILFWLIHEFVLHRADIVLFFPTPNETLKDVHIVGIVAQTVIVGPLLETLIFQTIVYHLLMLSKWFQSNKYMIVLVGAVIFSFTHLFTLSYVLFTLMTGALFMYSYAIKQDKGGYYGYWITVILHGLVNINALILWHLEK